MPKQSKYKKISSTMTKPKNPTLPQFTNTEISSWLTQSKTNLLNHPAKRKIFIGGKKTGKTRGTGLKMISLLMSNKDAYGLALKKYSGNATKRLHTNYSNLAIKLSRKYNIPEFKKSTDRTYILHNKSLAHISKNQSIEYASFENVSGLAGIEAPNAGYFALVHIEEPVEPNDSGKIPTQEEWDMAMDMVKDSVERANEEYNEFNLSINNAFTPDSRARVSFHHERLRWPSTNPRSGRTFPRIRIPWMSKTRLHKQQHRPQIRWINRHSLCPYDQVR